MIENIKTTSNIKMNLSLSNIYGNVDGLSLQNLFFAKNGYFPGCYLFDYESRTNGDYRFDTVSLVNYFIENTPKDEEIEVSPYFTKVMGKKKDNESLGFCIIFNKSNVYARFEKSVTDSYILFGNDCDKEFLNKIIDAAETFYVEPEVKQNNIWKICSNQNGYYLGESKVKTVENFDIDKLYNDDFKKESEKINSFIEEEDRSGLVILHGEKGTGKTSYIRNLINTHPTKKFVYVPANLISLLGDPSFGSFLVTLNNHIIVLEDCENAIRDRKESGSSSAVSLLLNMSDGLLSDDLGIKFICTFNDDVKNIDSALLRKGRLVSKYEFKPLTKEKTQSLLDEISVKAQVNKGLTLADIFNYEEDSYEKIKNSII